MKSVFTTGEAAEICKVSRQTIIRCFDSGRLKGFRVPGSRFRRIPREALLQFMKDNNIPPDSLDSGKQKVLVVDDDPEIVELFVDVLERDGRFEVKTAGTGYDAGILTQEFVPDLVILDYMLPDINGNVVCQTIRKPIRPPKEQPIRPSAHVIEKSVSRNRVPFQERSQQKYISFLRKLSPRA